MKKRIFSFLKALCLCLTLLPTAARAEKVESRESAIGSNYSGTMVDHAVGTLLLQKTLVPENQAWPVPRDL